MLRGLWMVFLAIYIVCVFVGCMGPLVTPALVASPLLGIAVFSVPLGWRDHRFFVATALAIAVAYQPVSLLLLGGPGTTWRLFGREFVAPPGVPHVLQTPVWLIAMVLPVVIAGEALRRTRRGRLG